MADEIIFDSNDLTQCRFFLGRNIRFISTAGSTLSDDRTYKITQLLCCAPVKDTDENWFYLYPDDFQHPETLKTWIEEISPMFPSLEIKIVSSKCKTLEPSNGTIHNDFLELRQIDTNSREVTMTLDFSDKSIACYSYTNKKNSINGNFSGLFFLVELFIDYYIKTQTKLQRNSYLKAVQEFAFHDISHIKEEFSKSYPVLVTAAGYNVIRVNSCDAIDPESVTPEKVIRYLSTLIIMNIDNISARITTRNFKLPPESKEKLYIQALYSQKTYTIEAYLAHHLIRAGLSFDFSEFIEQYFMIKKVLPDMYFWNLIFLTQFGFNNYYYYWLTSDRTFKLTNPETFNIKAHEWNDTSSLQFLRQFYLEYNGITHKHLKELYCAGKFKKMAAMLGHSIKISVKDTKKKKLSNLKIAENYNILSMDDKYYYIRGDDFRMHKYLKSNFNIVKVAV